MSMSQNDIRLAAYCATNSGDGDLGSDEGGCRSTREGDSDALALSISVTVVVRRFRYLPQMLSKSHTTVKKTWSQ